MKKTERDTLVLEFNAGKEISPIGSDEGGESIIKQYVRGIVGILGEKLLQEPRTHLSPKYGLSLWGPLEPSPEGGGTVHSYVWDNREQSFISVDVSTPLSLWNEKVEKLIQYTRDFFAVEDLSDLVHKTAEKPEAETWRELADDIYRQRLSLSAQSLSSLGEEDLKRFFPELCEVLAMDKISDPMISPGENGRKTAWMHWETSGGIIDVSEEDICGGQAVEMDIYTCKAFDPQVARDFIEKRLSLNILKSREF